MTARSQSLRVSAVTKRFGGSVALDRCTLEMPAGLVTGLIGPNGAGKTSLLNVVCGLVSPDCGTVHVGEREITGLPSHVVASLGIVRTFQIVRELSSLTLFENLLLAPGGQTGESLTGALLRRPAIRIEERRHAARARDILNRVGMWHLRDEPAGILSGGQKKLLELARAVLLEPSFILLDEPAAGVSPPLLDEIVRLIRELAAEGISFGIVEHDMHLIQEVCDQVHVMAEGRTLISGSFGEVTRDPRVVEAYLGLAA